MAEVVGVVEGISTKFNKWSILVNGTWYGTKEEWKPKVAVNKGDTVVFDDGGGKFIKRLKVVSGGYSHTVTSSPAKEESVVGAVKISRDRCIIRQNSITNAVNFLSGKKEVTPENVIDVARLFEAYSSGDLDEAEAEALIAGMSEEE